MSEITRIQPEPVPRRLLPMMFSEKQELPNVIGWYAEPQLNGRRVIATREGGRVWIYSQSFFPFHETFPAIQEEIRLLGEDIVLDGEIVLLDKEGRVRPDWLILPNQYPEAHPVCIAFDLLYVQGETIIDRPLLERRKMLEKALPEDGDHVRLIDWRDDVSPEEFLEQMGQQDKQGIVVKNPQSVYRPGHVTEDWIRVNIRKQELDETTSSTFS